MDSQPPKPIEKVSDDLRVINRTLNQVKTDLMCIKSETQQIKIILKEISDKIEVKEEITKGWLY
tara:strand:- start:879 stop:1070 length:192 start_codon:yes stop_codon:yes gene_type:complete